MTRACWDRGVACRADVAVTVGFALAAVALGGAACGGREVAPPAPLGTSGPSEGRGRVAPPGSPADAGPAAPQLCSTATECDDADACTEDGCEDIEDGEFSRRQCTHVLVAGCARPSAAGPYDAVDPSCAMASAPGRDVLLPFVPLAPPDLPASCDGGLEWQNCTATATASATRPEGAPARRLAVDLATYTAADQLRITGVDGSGAPYVLLDTCRVRTWDSADPTDGRTRPPDVTIRQWVLDLREGTRSLTFDSTAASTPFYVRVLGLCDFAPPATAGTACDGRIRAVLP